MTTPHPRCIVPSACILGESPVWVAADAALYWVDIKKPAIHRLDPATGAVTSWTPPLRIGALAPRAVGGFVAAGESSFLLIDPARNRYDPIAAPEPHLPGNRFNDGKLDSKGYFWAGTMDDAEERATGSLYRLAPDFSWTCWDEAYGVTNGPAFSPDGRTLYHTDSARQTIYAFDLDASGAPGTRRVLAQFGEHDGHPDGMTVDAEGQLWVAFWDGWCLRRIAPDGLVTQMVRMPVQRPTSCTFGGPAHDRLYVTSARVDLSESELADQPDAGGLFEVDAGACGVPLRPFAG